jgi:hypothetical protein
VVMRPQVVSIGSTPSRILLTRERIGC